MLRYLVHMMWHNAACLTGSDVAEVVKTKSGVPPVVWSGHGATGTSCLHGAARLRLM
jgi:hypothetical protein